VRGLGLQLINTDAAAEDAHYFTRILGGLWLAPFADFGVSQAIEGMNGAIDNFGRTDNQDFQGNAVGFGWCVGWDRRFRVGGLVGNKVFCHWDVPACFMTAMLTKCDILSFIQMSIFVNIYEVMSL
jgi:hypothetical protein